MTQTPDQIYIGNRIDAMFERLNVPQAMCGEGAKTAREAELTAIAVIILRWSANHEKPRWFDHFEEVLFLELGNRRTWPTIALVNAMASKASKAMSVVVREERGKGVALELPKGVEANRDNLTALEFARDFQNGRVRDERDLFGFRMTAALDLGLLELDEVNARREVIFDRKIRATSYALARQWAHSVGYTPERERNQRRPASGKEVAK